MLNRPPNTSDLRYTDLRLPGAVVVGEEERQDEHKSTFSHRAPLHSIGSWFCDTRSASLVGTLQDRISSVSDEVETTIAMFRAGVAHLDLQAASRTGQADPKAA